jgi:hypothetical protein
MTEHFEITEQYLFIFVSMNIKLSHNFTYIDENYLFSSYSSRLQRKQMPPGSLRAYIVHCPEKIFFNISNRNME